MIDIKSVSKTLCYAAVPLALISSQFLDRLEAVAAVSGFVLFSLNIIAMSFLAATLVQSTNGELSRLQKGLAMVAGLLKFLLLAGGLYIGLVQFELPGVFFGLGALIALFSVLWNFVTAYLRSLAEIQS